MKIQRTQMLARLVALAMATSTVIPSLAQAHVPSDVQSETVRFDDLNLTSQAGVQALYLRIRSAANDVCGLAVFPGARVPSVAWKDCVGASILQAVLKVNHPSLTAYYTDRLRATAFRTTG